MGGLPTGLGRKWCSACWSTRKTSDNFRVSGVGKDDGNRVDLTVRRSSKLKNLGVLKDELWMRAHAALPTMVKQLGNAPFDRANSR
jgi:hypothetical protein